MRRSKIDKHKTKEGSHNNEPARSTKDAHLFWAKIRKIKENNCVLILMKSLVPGE